MSNFFVMSICQMEALATFFSVCLWHICNHILISPTPQKNLVHWVCALLYITKMCILILYNSFNKTNLQCSFHWFFFCRGKIRISSPYLFFIGYFDTMWFSRSLGGATEPYTELKLMQDSLFITFRNKEWQQSTIKLGETVQNCSRDFLRSTLCPWGIYIQNGAPRSQAGKRINW